MLFHQIFLLDLAKIFQLKNFGYADNISPSFLYASLSLLYFSLTTAHEYSVHKSRCREAAYKKMATVASDYMLRTLFTAWLEDYKVTRRARRWFREQGGGEGEDSEEEKDWYWPEGDDPLSSLPRNIAVKVV